MDLVEVSPKIKLFSIKNYDIDAARSLFQNYLKDTYMEDVDSITELNWRDKEPDSFQISNSNTSIN